MRPPILHKFDHLERRLTVPRGDHGDITNCDILRSRQARRLDDLEKKYDAQFRVVFDAIRQMMKPAPKSNKSIGFQIEEDGEGYH